MNAYQSVVEVYPKKVKLTLTQAAILKQLEVCNAVADFYRFSVWIRAMSFY
jgi:hypothetical protein